MTLPALFLLRTLIEQHCLRVVQSPPADRKDVPSLLAAYKKELPVGVTSTCPSLKDLYCRLSEAVHEAGDDEALFLDASKRLTLHFEAVQLARKIAAVDGQSLPAQ